MDYCFHVWAGPASCHEELSDKLQKSICRSAGYSLAVSLEPLAHCWLIVANLSLLIRYYFVICSSELAQLVSLLYS